MITVIGCPVCSNPLTVKAAQGRRSNKPFIMLVCDRDPRHFRGFITHQEYVRGIMERKAGEKDVRRRLTGRGSG